jgi:hypothetical protein
LADKATQQETSVVAIIAANGNGRMSGEDGTYYRFNIGPSGNNLSGSFQGYSQSAPFLNGSQSTSGALSAFTTSAGLSGTFTDQAGGADGLLLNFDPVYNSGSSLTTLVGTWSYTAANGFSLTATIRSDGTFSALDSNNCSYSGAFGLIDPNFDAYSETYVRTCNGSMATFTGLASYLPAAGNATPAQITLLADDNGSDHLVADLQ